jgi:hypothetical protein
MDLALLLTGTGKSRAAMAVAAWLGHSPAGSSLFAPPLVVGNFGTAAAAADHWPIGQTLLVHRVRDHLEGESYYPERLLAWEGDESECVSLARPLQSSPDCGGKPVFDMEAFGVAEATALFLSSAHLVIGKCVSDHPGEENDWKALARRCEDDYRRGAELFFGHALEHARMLASDSRRQTARWVESATSKLMSSTRARLRLTVAQERQLAQHLRGCLARRPEDSELQRLDAVLTDFQAAGRAEARETLARLLAHLQAMAP